MKYSAYNNCDMVNGEGIRCTLWLSMCSHGCKGCFNESTWTDKDSNVFDEKMLQTLLEDLNHSYIQGLTLSGGDPLHKRNYLDVINLCKKVKETYPKKDIWLYTGYTLEQIQKDLLRLPVLEVIDILVDGKFEKDNPTKKLFRGSANQCMYSFVDGEVKLLGL